MNRTDKDIINQYNQNYNENELWYSFMNDGFSDLDINGYPIDIDFEIDEKYKIWKYQVNMYKKAIDTGNITKGKILDVACGRGGGLSFINDYYDFDELTGVDLNPNHISLAKQINKKNVKLFCKSIIDIDLESDYFDVINCIEANAYFKPYEKFVSNVYKFLKKDGVYIHITPYTERYLNVFESTGFKLEKIIDITKNVRMACAISKMRFKDISRKVSDILAYDEVRYMDDTSNYMIYTFRK